MDKEIIKIRYEFTFPFSLDRGGGRILINHLVSILSKKYEILPLDKTVEKVDFNVLLLFTFSALEADIIDYYKKEGVKVILFPIFDKLVPDWKMSILSKMYFPVHHEYIMRRRVCGNADLIITHNEEEKKDILRYYSKEPQKIKVYSLAINDEIIKKQSQITKDLFIEKYGLKDFVFCPAAQINKRKNQLILIKALKGSGIKLVLNNTQAVNDGLEKEFKELTEGDKDIICLQKLSLEELISCYKAAKVSVSVSQAETAGLVNLEALYLGCNLVVSNLNVFKEYLKNYAIYVDQNSTTSILEGVQKALTSEYDSTAQDFVLKNYSWDIYADHIASEIKSLLA